MSKTMTKNGSFWICVALAFVVAAVYCQVYKFDFLSFDDPDYAFENPNVQSGITIEAIKWAFTTGYSTNWHPLTWISHMLDWQLFGNNAGAHHLVNLIFHIANTLLLFIVLKQMTDALWQSAFVAALFALHPLHVESVAWVAERKDVLSTFFWILTMWAYLRYVKRPKILRYLLTVIFFALGLMAKPMLVTLPFVLLLLDYWPLERFGRQKVYRLIVEKVPLFVLSAASSVITFIIQRSWGAVVTTIPLRFRISNAFISYVKYMEKMFWPSKLAVFYPHIERDLSVSYAVMSAAVLLAITIFTLRFAKKHRYLVTGWLWYLGTLVPVIGIVQVGIQAMADRYTYITLTGLFIIIAWGLPEIFKRWRYKKIVLASLSLLIILTISICTYNQLGYWRNSLSLFQHTLDVTGNNYTANLCMAEVLHKQGRLNEAVYHCGEAIRIKPGAFQAHLKMGAVLRDTGRLDESAAEYQRCLKIRPNDPNVLNGYGITLSNQGKYDEAVKYFGEALRIRPDFAAAHDNMGHALTIQGNLEGAAAHLTKALQLDPDSALSHYNLGQVLVQSGKINEAIIHFDEAIRIKPDWAEPVNSLAWVLAVNEKAAILNPDRAVKLARRACELTDYKKPEFLDTLAVAYAAGSDFGKAIEITKNALELCQSPEKETLRKELESRLVFYKAGRPYVEKGE